MNGSVLTPVEYVGRWSINSVRSLGKAGYLTTGALRALRNVEIWGPRLVTQMVSVGVASVPIALFIAMFTGIVLALQASYTLTGAVPIYLVGTMVGKSMILELGPVLTGLSLAGRVGASTAAEVGTMRVTEQIDALETLAYDPLAYLVVPRVLAGMFMFPVVIVLASAMGILTGWAASLTLLDMSSAEFVRGLRLFFQPWDIQFSVIKSLSYGFLRPHRDECGVVLWVPCEGWSRGRRGGYDPHGGRVQYADPGSGRVLGGGPAMSIVLRDVHRAFGQNQVLRGLDLEVLDGETTSVIGFSGAGKSVVLKHMVGLIEPDSGDVVVDGQNLSELDVGELNALRRDIGYVFQFAALFDSMSIADNVAMGLRRIPGMYDDEIVSRVHECLALVELEGIEDRYPSELSGGMVKRAGLARAIATKPKYLLYDEPTTGLDPVAVTVIDRLIVRMKEELGVTGIVVTHDIESAYRISDRIAMLHDGRIRTSGTVDEIKESDDLLLRSFLEGRPELTERAS